MLGNGALATSMVSGVLSPRISGVIGATLTFALFVDAVRRDSTTRRWLDDRLLAGALTACTAFVLFAFF